MDGRHEDKLLGKILFKQYKLRKKIGEGSFGKIYIAINIDTKEEYAVKLVSKNIINKKIIITIILLLFNKKIIGKKRKQSKFIRN
jgi:serine/threonine protein kinase